MSSIIRVEKIALFIYNILMFIVGFLGWWYGAGWRARLGVAGARIARMFDYFSLDLLVRTWFAPFRQIDTGKQGRGIGEQFRVMVDALISRVIGGVVRTMTLVAGSIVLVVTTLFGFVEIIVWLFVPLLPIAGLVLFATGWVPYEGI